MDGVSVEQVETGAEQESSVSEAQTEEKTEVSEELGEITEEIRQSIIGPEYAKWQSETLTPMSKERDELRTQVTDLSNRLEDREDNKELDLLLKLDADEGDAVEARKKDEVRRSYTGRLSEFKRDSKMIKEAVKIAETLADEFTADIAAKMGFIDKTPVGILKAAKNAISSAGIANRRQMATEKAHELLMPNDKAYKKQRDAIVSELEQAESPEHMERLLKIIVRERAGKEKPFVPDSGRQSGEGLSLGKLSARELLVLGEKKRK